MLSGTRVAEQIEDALLHVTQRGKPGGKYTLFLRCDAAGVFLTKISAQITTLLEDAKYKCVVSKQCIS